MEKQILPLLALRGKMVYPNTSVYFEVSRPKSMAALEQAVNHEQRIFLVNQIDPSLDKPEEEDLYTVGTVAKILQMVKAGQGVLRVFVEGEARARITSYIEFDGCVKAEVEEIFQKEPDDTFDGIAGLLGVSTWFPRDLTNYKLEKTKKNIRLYRRVE